jgi:RNA polymerase sigma factor (TIGR02999 family)
MPHTHEITDLLKAWSDGDPEALEELMPLVDRELRIISHAYMKKERASHVLQTTALVAEALMRLMPEKISWYSRTQFYSLIARRMRQILIEHARGQLTAKRGNRVEHVDIADAISMSTEESQELLLLHEALMKLAKLDERKAKIVEHRYFGGFTLEEVAEFLDVSPSTIEREWRLARAWLKREISVSDSPEKAVS